MKGESHVLMLMLNLFDFVLYISCLLYTSCHYPHIKAGFPGSFLDTILRCLHRTHSLIDMIGSRCKNPLWPMKLSNDSWDAHDMVSMCRLIHGTGHS